MCEELCLVRGHAGVHETISALRTQVTGHPIQAMKGGDEGLKDLTIGPVNSASGNLGRLLSKEVPLKLKHEGQEAGQLAMSGVEEWGHERMF